MNRANHFVTALLLPSCSPTHSCILTGRAAHQLYDLNFGKRLEEELFDLRRDPAQLVNVAGRAEHAAAQKELRARVEQWMRDPGDPRVDPANDVWDGRVVDEPGNKIPGKERPPR